jgi:hypothetical protein
MLKEVVYLTRDNAIDLQLKADGVVVDLASVTRMILSDEGCAWKVDSSISPGAFNWAAGNGVLKLKLGDEVITPGTYSCYLIVYDPTNTDGVIWEKISIKFMTVCVHA